jgi:dTDP-4-amino-4,6-dideoxygalactose transaminase/predicted dehydrogenase
VFCPLPTAAKIEPPRLKHPLQRRSVPMTAALAATDDLRLAVVGLGYWGPNILRSAHEVEGIAVPVACDPEPAALERQARRYRLLKLTRNVDEVLEDPSIDAVVLATPIRTHFDLGRRALLAGKHVLVEKPLASTSEECRALIELAEREDRVLMPGHTFVYSPPVIAVRDLIANGELGTIHFVTSSRVNLGVHQRDVSVVRDLAPHDFSILLYWLGAPTFIRAIGRDAVVPGVIDVAFIDLGYEDGCVAHVDLSWLAPTKLRRTVVVGERKMVVYEDTSPEPVRVFDRGVEVIDPQSFGEFQLSYRSGDILSPHLHTTEPLKLELQDFVQAIRQRSRPRSSAELGLDVVRMVQAAENSLQRSGAAVALEPLDLPTPRRGSPDRLDGRSSVTLDGGNGLPTVGPDRAEPPPVPFIDIRRATAPLMPEIRSRFEQVVRQGAFTLGDELTSFESEFAAYCGVAHCAGVSDGTSALRLALTAIGVGPGDEVITVPFTFVGTVEAIWDVGARPVLVDIDSATRCMSPALLAEALTPRTRAVIPVHIHGHLAPLKEISEICAAAGVPVLEDAAQAHGARLDGRPAGSLGSAAAFSFYPTKNLGAFGDGGAVVSDDAELIELVRSLRHHGSLPDDPNRHVRAGGTARLDNVQAAVLRVKLPWLDDWNAQRRQTASRYRRLLAELPLALPPDDPAASGHAYHVFAVEVPDRERVRDALLAEGVETGVHYPDPVHRQPVWRGREPESPSFPASEALAERVLSLPLFPGITEREVETVATALTRVLEGHRPRNDRLRREHAVERL